MQRAFYTILIFVAFILLETVFVAFSTGYLFVQFKSPLLENMGFYATLAGDDVLMTLRFVLIENPLLIIQSQYRQTETIVWSLHYYPLTLLVHLVLAVVLADMRLRFGPAFKYQALPLAGTALLLSSTLYLFLGSCCSGGPNWIMQTWLLAIVFNPVTSSNATILLYQSLIGGFVILQVISGVLGGYMLFYYYRKKHTKIYS